MTVPDEEYWREALRGHGESFGVIFDRHRARVGRHARSLVPTSADIDDVVAITFLEAWRKGARVRFVDGSMLPWLLRTATYTAANLRRSALRHRAALQRLTPAEPTSVDRYGEGDEPVVLALGELPLAHRQVVVLCVIEGLSTDEAATALGVRPGTVKSRLSRAKAALRTRLGSETAEPEWKEVSDVR